jgi:hypothetical protein
LNADIRFSTYNPEIQWKTGLKWNSLGPIFIFRKGRFSIYSYKVSNISYNKTGSCINWTLNKPESCINWTLNKTGSCINRTLNTILWNLRIVLTLSNCHVQPLTFNYFPNIGNIWYFITVYTKPAFSENKNWSQGVSF